MPPVPTFESSHERTLWVQSQLRLRGLSFAAIARTHGWTRWTVAAAMFQPSYRQEKAISAALGVEQQVLFSERYDTRGNRLHPVKNHKPAHPESHSENHEAA